MYRWAENSGLSDGSLDHLRSIRRGNGTNSSCLYFSLAYLHHRIYRRIPVAPIASILLAPSLPDGPFPVPPVSLPKELSKPYKTSVPSYPSRTPEQIRAKNLIWPCLYQPRRPSDTESYDWTEIEINWNAKCIERVLNDARKAQDTGDVWLPLFWTMLTIHSDIFDVHVLQLGISSLVCSFTHLDVEFAAHDTRKSAHHPLRHSVMNVIRQVADFQAEQNNTAVPFTAEGSSSSPAVPETTPASESQFSLPASIPYLLTNMTLFTTHEPCIMCSMALVHSRVARVFFVRDMPLTGGCGGVVGVTGGTGVNHRYDVYQWFGDKRDAEREDNCHIEDQDLVDDYIDA